VRPLQQVQASLLGSLEWRQSTYGEEMGAGVQIHDAAPQLDHSPDTLFIWPWTTQGARNFQPISQIAAFNGSKARSEARPQQIKRQTGSAERQTRSVVSRLKCKVAAAQIFC